MKSFLISLIVCFCLITPLASMASHGAGAELRYEHLSGNDYRFYFTFYRDCAGISVNNFYTIYGTSVCGGSISLTVDSDSTVHVSQLCAGLDDQCNNFNSLYKGFEASYFHGDVTIPSLCSLWTFGISPICNRNQYITNLVSPTMECLYVETKLNNDSGLQNSSPVFTALPFFQLYNQVQYLHLYAQDPDGDSLAFEMYTPHSSATADVQYSVGLSAFQPVTYAVPADSTTFDPLTGDIRFKADGAQVTVVAVRVNEFRNGIFVGSEERDIEVIFNNSTNRAPIASGINGSLTIFTTHICADSLFTFHINTIDLDGDSIRMLWQNSIPGSTINLSGVNNQIANFNWQPTASDISAVPHTFILYVTDSVCPFVYFNSYQYRIYVDSCFVIPVASFTSPQDVCAGSCISFTNLSVNASSYQWYFPGSIQDTSSLPDPPGICYPTSGNYDVQLIVGNSTGSDTLLFPNYVTVYPTAQAQSITQIGDSLFAIQGAATYQWYLNNTIIAGATDYFYFATANGNYKVVATDSNGCESEAVITEVIVGLNELEADKFQMIIFPNPVKDKLEVRSLEFGETAAEISIYNVIGEKILLETDLGSMTVNCQSLKPGIYFLEVFLKDKSYRGKFVKADK